MAAVELCEKITSSAHMASPGRVTFDEFSLWYNDGGFTSAPWLELLDLRKWPLVNPDRAMVEGTSAAGALVDDEGTPVGGDEGGERNQEQSAIQLNDATKGNPHRRLKTKTEQPASPKRAFNLSRAACREQECESCLTSPNVDNRSQNPAPGRFFTAEAL